MNLFTLEEEGESVTVSDLKDKFYNYHRVKDKEKYRKYRKENFVLRPRALVLNPPGFKSNENDPDTFVAVYYRGFMVRIECHHKSRMSGPHKLELHYQVRIGLIVWLGTWTSNFAFDNELVMRKKLRKAILLRLYYCSPGVLEQVVDLTPPQKGIEL